MIDGARLAEPMSGEGCSAELYSDKHHDTLKAACAEDGEIWRKPGGDEEAGRSPRGSASR